jgi:hypothetical protein
MRTVRRFGVLVAAVALLGAAAAGATHNIPRDLSIKHSAAKKRFKGKLKSQVADCRAGVVTLVRIEPGPNPIVGSATATGGRWAIRAGGHGRFYAESASFQAPGGFCPKVRSRVIRV